MATFSWQLAIWTAGKVYRLALIRKGVKRVYGWKRLIWRFWWTIQK